VQVSKSERQWLILWPATGITFSAFSSICVCIRLCLNFPLAAMSPHHHQLHSSCAWDTGEGVKCAVYVLCVCSRRMSRQASMAKSHHAVPKRSISWPRCQRDVASTKCTPADHDATTTSKPSAGGAGSGDVRRESTQTMNEWLTQLGPAAQSLHTDASASGSVEMRQTMPPRLIGRRHKCELITTASSSSPPSLNHLTALS